MGHSILVDHLRKYQGKVVAGLHVGANSGQERQLWRKVGAHRVLWVEANPEMMPELRENILRFKGHTAHCAMLGNQNKENVPFHIFGHGGASSMLDKVDGESAWGLKKQRTILRPMIRAEVLIGDLGIKPGTLNTAVIDVQGAELKVLKGFGKYLPHMQYVVVEYIVPETYKGADAMTEVVLFMLSKGFHLWTAKPRKPETGDLLFVRGVPVKRNKRN